MIFYPRSGFDAISFPMHQVSSVYPEPWQSMMICAAKMPLREIQNSNVQEKLIWHTKIWKEIRERERDTVRENVGSPCG